jgi:GDP-D-mannose 3', 5'-epimerase
MMKKNFWKDKKVLVTGGAGFIGGTLVRALRRNHICVQVIDNLWRGSYMNLEDEHGEFVIDMENDFHLADLTDYAIALELIRNVDIVFHLADVVAGIDFVFNNELFVFRQNILINTNTLAACLANRIQNYVYVGTACSFPRHLQMADKIAHLHEDQTYPAEPESSYGWSKLMGEYEAEVAKKGNITNIGLLRLHNVYGPYTVFDEQRSQVIPSLIRKAVRYPKEEFIVWGSGNQYRDFVYVDDIVNALLLVSEQGMNCGVIQIGTEQATSIRELAETIIKLSGKPITAFYDDDKAEGDRGRVAVCDRARTILGWQPRVHLQQGLAQTYQWIYDQIIANN